MRMRQRLRGLSCHRQKAGKIRGFTLLEIMIAMSIVVVLAAIAVPNYLSMREKAQYDETIKTLRELSAAISLFVLEKDRYPADLGEVGFYNIRDHWDQPFVYNTYDTASKKLSRKYKNEQPINTDYDLLSIGKDGLTATQIQKKECDDDIIRANNGGYFGYGEDY